MPDFSCSAFATAGVAPTHWKRSCPLWAHGLQLWQKQRTKQICQLSGQKALPMAYTDTEASATRRFKTLMKSAASAAFCASGGGCASNRLDQALDIRSGINQNQQTLIIRHLPFLSFPPVQTRMFFLSSSLSVLYDLQATNV